MLNIAKPAQTVANLLDVISTRQTFGMLADAGQFAQAAKVLSLLSLRLEGRVSGLEEFNRERLAYVFPEVEKSLLAARPRHHIENILSSADGELRNLIRGLAG